MYYVEDAYDIEEEFLSPMQRYEIRFSTSKPKKNFILKSRSSSRLDLMSNNAVKIILQEWIDRTFETPYRVNKVFSVENL